MSTINVLVVEDEPAIQRFYRSIFSSPAGRRFSPRFASDAPEALSALEREPVDLAVLDWTLPSGDGTDLAGVIRRREETKDVGILMVTARRSGADTILALKSGADDHLPKPFDPEMLLMRLHGLVRRRGLGEAPDAESRAPLTILEKNILQLFLRRMDAPTREELCSALWSGDEIWMDVLDGALASLRRKLGPAWEARLRTRLS